MFRKIIFMILLNLLVYNFIICIIFYYLDNLKKLIYITYIFVIYKKQISIKYLYCHKNIFMKNFPILLNKKIFLLK